MYQGKLLRELLEQYSDLKICLDSARVHILSNRDNNLDYKKIIKEFGNIHQRICAGWNTNYTKELIIILLGGIVNDSRIKKDKL